MVFLKLVHTESQVNPKTQPFWVNSVHLVPNVQTLAGHAIGPMVSNGLCQLHAQLGVKHWVLDTPPWTKTFGFCDLLGTLYAPVSKIPSVKNKNYSKKNSKEFKKNFLIISLYFEFFYPRHHLWAILTPFNRRYFWNWCIRSTK